MKCPKCVEMNLKSTVNPGACFSTGMGYIPYSYDEEGKLITHPDPNIHYCSYTCSNGHSFKVMSRNGDPDKIIF